MDKVLKLSNKIANAGFEPDMWYGDLDYFGGGKGLFLRYSDSFSSPLPYFSADWCWKILPEKIKVNIELIKNSIRYPINNIEINDSLHEALLELVCWCIDNGYLKVQEDNARL